MSARYLLDTNLCIYIARHNPPAVRERFARHGSRELAMSVITLGELRFGAEKSQSRERSLAGIARLRTLRANSRRPEQAGATRRQQRPVARCPRPRRRLDSGDRQRAGIHPDSRFAD